MTHHLGVDTTATAGSHFVRRLRNLKSTVRLIDYGRYRECPEWRMLYLETTMTEPELDDWCYRFHDSTDPFIEANAFEWQREIPQ